MGTSHSSVLDYTLRNDLVRLSSCPCPQARAQFEMASREEGHAQAAAFAWLGNWEREVGGNAAAARELYDIALDLDPAEPAAGTRAHLLAMINFASTK